MELLLKHWSLDPALAGVAISLLVHAVGLRRRLRAVRRAGHPTRSLQVRALAFYAGLALLVVAIDSPLDYWSRHYLFAHMIQHILLALGAPPLIVIGAPWLPLQRGLPAVGRRWLARVVQSARRKRPVRVLARFLTNPVLAVVSFNAVMLGWHLPYLFDLALRNGWVHVWGEHLSMFVFAMLLWLQVFDSPPLHPRLHPLQRCIATISTNAVMVGLAMTLVLFSNVLYPVYLHQAHAFINASSDQQVAGSALWVCGEFSLAPAVYWNVQRWLASQRSQASEVQDSPWAAFPSPWQRLASRWVNPSPATIESGWRHRSGTRSRHL